MSVAASVRSASIQGSATGEGGEFVICDDPNATGESDDVRILTNEWWDSTMPTRLNNPKTGHFIIIQQRTAENDLTGHLLSKGGYVHLKIPFEYEGDKNRTIIDWEDPRDIEGDAMCRERFSPDDVEFWKRELGSFKAAGQLQQRPTSKAGGVFNPAWFQTWTKTTLPETFDEWLISWDFAFKGNKDSDYVVGQVWGRKGSKCYLLDQVRKKMDFVKTLDAVVALCNRWPQVTAKVFEAKANGDAIISALRGKIRRHYSSESKGQQRGSIFGCGSID